MNVQTKAYPAIQFHAGQIFRDSTCKDLDLELMNLLCSARKDSAASPLLPAGGRGADCGRGSGRRRGVSVAGLS